MTTTEGFVPCIKKRAFRLHRVRETGHWKDSGLCCDGLTIDQIQQQVDDLNNKQPKTHEYSVGQTYRRDEPLQTQSNAEELREDREAYNKEVMQSILGSARATMIYAIASDDKPLRVLITNTTGVLDFDAELIAGFVTTLLNLGCAGFHNRDKVLAALTDHLPNLGLSADLVTAIIQGFQQFWNNAR
jgi:hypothetical protein